MQRQVLKTIIDDELTTAFGHLSWQGLCERVTKIPLRQMAVAEEVLAAVPVEYTSVRDEFIRLPPLYLEDLCRWHGWKLGMDELLEQAGGCMAFRELRAAMVARYKVLAGSTAAAASDEDLGACALASLPAAYLSKRDEFVRLPGA